MKWKSDVVVDGNKEIGYSLVRNNNKIPVMEKYSYLIQAIQGNNNKESTLVELIMREEGFDESTAGFVLADFIIEYGEYIAENHDYYEIKY